MSTSFVQQLSIGIIHKINLIPHLTHKILSDIINIESNENSKCHKYTYAITLGEATPRVTFFRADVDNYLSNHLQT